MRSRHLGYALVLVLAGAASARAQEDRCEQAIAQDLVHRRMKLELLGMDREARLKRRQEVLERLKALELKDERPAGKNGTGTGNGEEGGNEGGKEGEPAVGDAGAVGMKEFLERRKQLQREWVLVAAALAELADPMLDPASERARTEQAIRKLEEELRAHRARKAELGQEEARRVADHEAQVRKVSQATMDLTEADRRIDQLKDQLQELTGKGYSNLLVDGPDGPFRVTNGVRTWTFEKRADADAHMEKLAKGRKEAAAALQQAREGRQVWEQDLSRAIQDEAVAAERIAEVRRETERLVQECATRHLAGAGDREQARRDRLAKIDQEIARAQQEIEGLRRQVADSLARVAELDGELARIVGDGSQEELRDWFRTAVTVTKAVAAYRKLEVVMDLLKGTGELAGRTTGTLALAALPVQIGVRLYGELRSAMPTLEDIPLVDTGKGYEQYQPASVGEASTDINRNTAGLLTTANLLLQEGGKNKRAWEGIRSQLSRIEGLEAQRAQLEPASGGDGKDPGR